MSASGPITTVLPADCNCPTVNTFKVQNADCQADFCSSSVIPEGPRLTPISFLPNRRFDMWKDSLYGASELSEEVNAVWPDQST